MSEIMKRDELIDIIADYVVDYPRFEETAHEVAEIIYDRISPQWVSVANYIAESEGEKFLLIKGYKPALEELVLELGWAKEHHGNRLYVELPLPSPPIESKHSMNSLDD